MYRAASKAAGFMTRILTASLAVCPAADKGVAVGLLPGKGTKQENAALCITPFRTRARRPLPAQYLMDMRYGTRTTANYVFIIEKEMLFGTRKSESSSIGGTTCFATR